MKYGLKIKTVFAKFLYYSGILHQKLNKIPREHGIILTYHRVLPRDKVTPQIESGMYVTPESFENHIKTLKKYFEIISLNELHRRFSGLFSYTASKPYAVITFDDGWADFLNYAFPLINKHQIPCTIFLPTSFIGNNRKFWTEELADLITQIYSSDLNNHLINDTSKKILHAKGTFEQRFDFSVNLLKEYNTKKIYSILDELNFLKHTSNNDFFRSFLNWDEIKLLVNNELISTGSHTVNHEILTNLNEEEVINELRFSRQKLIDEDVVSPDFIPFCYPNGNYNEHTVNVVKREQYNLAVTTRYGWNYLNENIYTLPRINIHEDISSTESLLMYRLITCHH
jgi:peptidoglycan/xylan/chitin deacetylase (PgdA/CDA1 family)